MNTKDLAEYMIENLHEDRDCKIVAKAYLAQEAKIQGLVEALKEYADKNMWDGPDYLGGSFDEPWLTAEQALTAYKEGN